MSSAQDVRSAQAEPKPKIEGVGYDRLVTLAAAWLLIGLFIDGWAHINTPELETFFTPWHAILYSGALTLGGLIVGAVLVNQRRGYAKLSEAIPRGYRMSLIGVPLFFIGGLSDLLWHELIGIEVSIEALLSPPHLLLALGGVLMGGGPNRAAWFRKGDAYTPLRWSRALPMLFSIALLLSVLYFFTAFVSPFARVASSNVAVSTLSDAELTGRVGQTVLAVGIGSVLVYTALTMGGVLMAAKRWRGLPFGSMTMILALPVALQVAIRDLPGGGLPYLGAAIVAGLISDALYAAYRHSGAHPMTGGNTAGMAYRALALGTPVALFGAYFAAVQFFGGGLWWTVHVWAGAVAMAGITGWVLSYLVWQPGEN